ncbi:MAG TPA: DUF3592 domain-containing protein [Edaphobacter sp.]|nr:DUF3592 domain-containing protein [Edaphobacter sp.]
MVHSQAPPPGLCFGYTTVLTTLPDYLSVPLRSPRGAALAAGAVAAVAGVTWYLIRRRRPTPEEIERARRSLLAAQGRITDGSITDAPSEGDPADAPKLIVYNYRIAGVAYEAAQDVSALSNLVRDIRADLPIQVRYEPHNPANSIVVAEQWSGLRLGPHHDDPHTDSNPSHAD